jgi:uncharacterized protein involved in outer membrane biogenesis
MMADGRGWRWGLVSLVALVVLILGCIVGFHVAAGVLKNKVIAALGPDSEIKDIRVGWTGVNVDGLRIKGPHEWPVADTLRAERITLVPSLRSLFSRQYRVRSITIVKPYLSVLRTRSGKILVVPSLMAGKSKEETPSPHTATTTVTLGSITLQDGVLELYDASVSRPPLKIRLEKIQAKVKELAVPTLYGRSRFDLTGMVKGVHQDGRADISGWVEIATKDSSLKLQLRSVDLVALQPYIIKANEDKVQKGTLDLDLQSDVSNNRLKAPGRITISDLKLSQAKGVLGTFMGMPRDVVLAFLERKGNKITLDFILEGDINNPKFSLNNSLSERLAISMAEVLKVSLGGVAKGAAGLGGRV